MKPFEQNKEVKGSHCKEIEFQLLLFFLVRDRLKRDILTKHSN